MKLQAKERVWAAYVIPVGIMLVFLVFNAGFISMKSFPRDDSAAVFIYFQHTYQEFQQTGTFPYWNPYFQYGYDDEVLNIIYNSPLSAFSMLLGKWMGLSDSWFSFNFFVYSEIFVLILGMYLLMSLFVRSKHALFVGIGALALTNIIITNIWTHSRPVYLIPLGLYFMFLGFKEKRLYYIAISFGFAATSIVGNPPYWIPIYLLIYSFLFIYLFLTYFPGIKARPALNFPNLFAFGMLGIYCGDLLYFLVQSRLGQTFLAPARDPETLKVPLEVFLSWGGNGLKTTLQPFVGFGIGGIPWTDFYLTTVGLVFLLYAFFAVRSRLALLIKLLFLLFFFLPWGEYSLVAIGAYYLPTMALFRHLVALFCVTKVFAAILIGLGVEQFLRDDPALRLQRGRLAIAVSFTATFVLAMQLYPHFSARMPNNSMEWFLTSTLVINLVLLVTIRWRLRLFLQICILLVILQSAMSFWEYTYAVEYPLDFRVKEATVVDPLTFEEKRIPNDRLQSIQGNRWLELAKVNPVVSSFLYGAEASKPISNIDFCLPYRMDRINNIGEPVHRLMQLLAPELHLSAAEPQFYQERKPNEVFLKTVGCGLPKLQLYSDFEELPQAPTADPNLLRQLLDRGVYLEAPKTGQSPIYLKPRTYPETRTLKGQGIEMVDFSNNHLELKVETPPGAAAWLIYLDSYDADWNLEVDGQPAGIWKANIAFKALKLPAGTHQVRFTFGGFIKELTYWGINLFGVVLIGLGLFIGYWRIHRGASLYPTDALKG